MTPRVLLVDDDEQMRRSTAQALDLAGFAVEAVGSGEEALTLAGPGFSGAVVSDIRMPGMDGMTLLGRLHEIDPDIPVILFTGHAEVPLAVEAIRGGAYDFIEKPFVVQELATVIRRAIDHRDLILDNRRLRAVADALDRGGMDAGCGGDDAEQCTRATRTYDLNLSDSVVQTS